MTLLAIVAIHTAANEPLKARQVMNKIHRNVGWGTLYLPVHQRVHRGGDVYAPDGAAVARIARVARVQCPRRRREWVRGLVERFGTEWNPDFSAKWANFRGLLFCVEADFCTQIRIVQHFSRTTTFAILCTAPISKFEQNFMKLFRIFVQNSAKFAIS